MMVKNLIQEVTDVKKRDATARFDREKMRAAQA